MFRSAMTGSKKAFDWRARLESLNLLLTVALYISESRILGLGAQHMY